MRSRGESRTPVITVDEMGRIRVCVLEKEDREAPKSMASPEVRILCIIGCSVFSR